MKQIITKQKNHTQGQSLHLIIFKQLANVIKCDQSQKSQKKFPKNKITNLQNIKLKFIEDENQTQKSKKKKGNIYGIDQSLVCNTCNFLPENPTTCYKCNTLFCRKCLENYVNEKQRCPKCLKLITRKSELIKEKEKLSSILNKERKDTNNDSNHLISDKSNLLKGRNLISKENEINNQKCIQIQIKKIKILLENLN